MKLLASSRGVPAIRFVRSRWFPTFLAGLFAVLGVPVFLRLPLWCDVTLYDVAARSLLAGGVHYRDVFDTNPPGFVWCLTLLRATLGTSTIAVRAVDLAVFAGIVLCLDRLAKLGGGSRTSRAWAAAGMLAIYLFSTEYIHAQRDIWLALPALVALVLRLRRIGSPLGYFWPAVAEGLLWGAAAWIKPQVIPIALFAWLLTVRRLSAGSWKIAALDLAGNFAAGAALGLLGFGYLIASGTWPHYWVVMTEWNVHYSDLMFKELDGRIDLEWTWFRPWSGLLIPSMLLVFASLIDGRIWSARWLPAGRAGPVGRVLGGILFDPAPTDPARFTRAVLAGVFFVWTAVSLLFQREFIYVHVLEVLLMLALWASHRWCLPALGLAWIAALNLAFRIADDSPDFQNSARIACRRIGRDFDRFDLDYRHPLARRGYFYKWTASFNTSTTGQDDARLKDRLKREKPHVATTNWEELGEVAEYLRGQNAKDREVVCWNEGVHPLYLLLGLQPGIRFMHVHNTDGISPVAGKLVRGELKMNLKVRFVVVDLEWVAGIEGWDSAPTPYRPGRGHPAPNHLLPKLSQNWDGVFPYDRRRTVFRSNRELGRYVVFAVTVPLGTVD